jgi:hypothetical protein
MSWSDRVSETLMIWTIAATAASAMFLLGAALFLIASALPPDEPCWSGMRIVACEAGR